MGAHLSAEEKAAAEASPLDEDETKVVVKHFKQLVKKHHDHDGVDANELHSLLVHISHDQELSPPTLFTETELDFIFFNTDHDGKVNLAELLEGVYVLLQSASGVGKYRKNDQAKLIAHWFKALDRGKTGFLTREDVTRPMAPLARYVAAQKDVGMLEDQYRTNMTKAFTGRAIDVMFQADADGDGKLSPEEWANAVKGTDVGKGLLAPCLLTTFYDAEVSASKAIKDYTPPK